MKEVKRYEAVHLRYEERNIRYGEGCEVEVVAGYDYYELLTELNELLVVAERLLDNPLTGNPTLERLVEFWEYEKSQGNGYAAVQLAAISVIKKCRGEK